MLKIILLFVSVMLTSLSYAQEATTQSKEVKFEFDESLLLGYSKDGSMDGVLDNLLNQSQWDEGKYNLDIYINDAFFRRTVVDLVSDQGNVVPCISRPVWQAMGVLKKHILHNESMSCAMASDSSFRLDKAKLNLSIFVPQAYMETKPKGYISPEQWSYGETALFTNYDANYYHSKQNFNHENNENSSLFVGLRTGMNLDDWRVRSQFNYSYNETGKRSQRRLSHTRTYAKSALPQWESEITLGQIYTSDNVFDSVSFDGAEIKSDPRMLPMSQRGYAPVIVGMANSVATVTVSQQGREIYQQTVSPGPFEIKDISSPYYRGDFDVLIEEADGKVNSFTVPFNPVPGAMRLGHDRYGLAAGQVNLAGVADEPYFIQGVYERGITNNFTSNAGLRVSEDYLGASLGLVLGTRSGAFGIRSSLSRASIGEHSYDGWRAGLDYSVGFERTDTTITLASYRYSSRGYRTLSDFARMTQLQSNQQDISLFQSERNFFSLNVDQSLPGMGRLNFSGSHTIYRGRQDSITQAQLNYSTQLGKASLNIGYLRSFEHDNSTSDNVISLGITIPFGASHYPTMASFNVRNADDGTTYQTGLSGQLSAFDNTTYGLSYSSNQDNASTLSMNLNKLSPKATYGATLSRGDNYTQWGVSTRGGMVLHQGGINFTESLGDTFAIIKADKATGARIRNSFGGVIDNNGYGIANHLAPYKLNQVSLDPSTMVDPDIELKETQFRLVPTAGAIMLYDVHTMMGKAVLIQIKGETIPPLGADISDQQGTSLGMVSQSGLAYVRLSKLKGMLFIHWGKNDKQRCVIDYNISDDVKGDSDFFKLSSVCQS